MDPEPTFEQTFELVDQDPFELIADLIIAHFRNEALQDALVHRTAPKEPPPAPDPKPPGSLLSVSETAVILGVTEDTIRKWARAGKIGSVRLSKVDVRFRQVDLDEFIGSRLRHRKSAFRSR